MRSLAGVDESDSRWEERRDMMAMWRDRME
jgi:hypothetical protein